MHHLKPSASPFISHFNNCALSWFQYIRSPDSPLDAATKASVEVTFVGSKGDFALEEEAVRSTKQPRFTIQFL